MAFEVYENSIVENHEQAVHFLTSLAEVSIRDYQQDYGFSDQISALDIDAWEKSKSGNSDKTMDTAIGIADYVNNQTRSQRLLLVELRMNYSGHGQNSKTSDMKGKNQHTRDLLLGSAVDNRSFFIFSKNVAPIVRRRIASESQVDRTLQSWKILSPEDFINLFQFVENLPYVPESPIADIKGQGCHFVAIAEFENAIKLLSHWTLQARLYKDKYKLEESKAIMSVIQEVLSDLALHESEIVGHKCELDYLIVREEIENLVRSMN